MHMCTPVIKELGKYVIVIIPAAFLAQCCTYLEERKMRLRGGWAVPACKSWLLSL